MKRDLFLKNIFFAIVPKGGHLSLRGILLIFSLVFFTSAYAQELTLTGKIKDADGKPIPGALVRIKESTLATAADPEGIFKLSVPENLKDSTLVISALGFIPKEIKLNGQTDLNIQVEAAVNKLNEVVIIGYGTQKKSDLTGAISSVTGEDLAKANVLTADQALQGRASGVQVTQNTGSPGSPVSVRIRGLGTVGNSNPLYVVDGLPLSDISFLNPNDIASVEVLKDASASAIYGSRAANGVVLITTKQGKAGKTVVNFDTYSGIQSAWRKINMLDAEHWAMLNNEAKLADGKDINPDFANPASLGKGTDWQNEIFRTAKIQNHQLSVSGGNDKNTFAMSGNYFKQDGILNGTDATRLSYRINANHQVSTRLKVGENLNFTHSERNNFLENEEFNSVINQALTIDPVTPVTNPDGSFASSKYNNIKNPVALIEHTNSLYKTNRIVGGLYAEFQIIEGLKFKTNLGMDLTFGNFYGYTPMYFMSASENSLVNTVSRQYDQWTTALLENTLSYSKTFNKRHAINAIGGITTQNGKYENIIASRNNLPSDDPGLRYLDAATSTTAVALGGANEWALLSYLGRVNYVLDDKYLLTASFRVDGSSRFIGKNRFGSFPSLSLGWKISQEDFMKAFPTISTLKLRAGWGQTGNQDIGNGTINGVYPYSTTIAGSQNYTFNKTRINGSAPLSAGNNEIKWETVSQTNIGLDMGLWDDRVTFAVDAYLKNTTDMLVQLPVPQYVGLQIPPFVNAASVQNKGLEFSLNYRKTEGLFNYNAGGNISFVHNEVISLGEGGAPIFSGDFRGIGQVNKTDVGQAIASFYGYQTDGLFQNAAEVNAGHQPNAKPGDIRFKDLNGDGVIDDKDRTYLGSPIPTFTYGFNLGGAYKNFDISIFFQGSYGNKIFNGNKYYLEGGVGYTNMSGTMLNRWTGEGTSTTTPRMTESDPNQNRRISDRYVEDGSYMRIKNMQLGYTLPKNTMSYAHIAKLRIYVGAQNLLTFTRYTGYDPEIGIGRYGSLDIGIDRGTYPQARTITIGANVTF